MRAVSRSTTTVRRRTHAASQCPAALLDGPHLRRRHQCVHHAGARAAVRVQGRGALGHVVVGRAAAATSCLSCVLHLVVGVHVVRAVANQQARQLQVAGFDRCVCVWLLWALHTVVGGGKS